MVILQDGDYKVIKFSIPIELFDNFLTYYYKVEKEIDVVFDTCFAELFGEEMYMTKITTDLKTFEEEFGYMMNYEKDDELFIDYYSMFDKFMDVLDDLFYSCNQIEDHIVYKNSRDDVFVKYLGTEPTLIQTFGVWERLIDDGTRKS